MFKRSLIGYSKKSMEEARNLITEQADIQKEEIEKLLNEALVEQSQFLEELKLADAQLEEARAGTVLAEKFQQNISTVISEVRTSFEEINGRKIKEAKDFCSEIDEQIALLDQQIILIKQKLKALVQGLGDTAVSMDYQEADETRMHGALKDLITHFTIKAKDREDPAISTELFKLKGLNRGEALEIQQESKSPAVDEGLKTTAAQEPEEAQSFPSSGVQESDNRDEAQSRRFFDQMRHSLEQSASTYTLLNRGVKIAAENEQYERRAQEFMDNMRMTWQRTISDSAQSHSEELSNPEFEEYIEHVQQFLERMRSYWRGGSPEITDRIESDAGLEHDEQYNQRARQFFEHMRQAWISETGAASSEPLPTMEDEAYELRARRFLDNMRQYWRS